MTDQLASVYQEGFSSVAASDVAAFVGKTFTAEDTTVVTSLIAALESRIATACRRQFKYVDSNVDQVYYETVDAGKYEYITHNFPIKEVTKITVNGVIKYQKNGNSNILTLGTDLFVYPDRICMTTPLSSAINNSRAMVLYYTISQFWGSDVKHAIKQWAAELFLNREYGGESVTQFSVTGQSLQFDTTTLPKYVQQVVDSYKKMLI